MWPYSRDKYPKQFIDFFGCGRTQLQLTFDRFTKILPKENVLVCTNSSYATLVREQLPELNSENILIEPVNRNTAPCVAWADLIICSRNAKARVIVSPSDQYVTDEEAFADNVRRGLDYVGRHEQFLSMGVTPTRPEPGYGYIQAGDESDTKGVYAVQSFTEKPERNFANLFMESGEFYWNTGLFLFSAQHFHHKFQLLFPEERNHLKALLPDFTPTEAISFVADSYASFPNLSIDYAVLERCSDVQVMKCNFGWADLGTWHSVYECMQKGDDDNVVVDSDVIMGDCRNNVIKLPRGKLGVIDGLDGYIVVDKDDVLLICKKEDSSALVRKYANEAQMKFGDKYM